MTTDQQMKQFLKREANKRDKRNHRANF